MARIKRGVTTRAKHKRILEQCEGLLRPPQEHHPHRPPGRREGRAICLSRPQGEEAQLPRLVDPAHQRRGPRRGTDLWPVHPRAEARQHRPRPEGPGRHRDARRPKRSARSSPRPRRRCPRRLKLSATRQGRASERSWRPFCCQGCLILGPRKGAAAVGSLFVSVEQFVSGQRQEFLELVRSHHGVGTAAPPGRSWGP